MIFYFPDKNNAISCATVLLIPADTYTYVQSRKSTVGPFKHLFIMLDKPSIFHYQVKVGRTLEQDTSFMVDCFSEKKCSKIKLS